MLRQCFGACRRAALQAITGIGDGALIGALAQGQALDAHAQALVVHHGEHGIEALVRLADQVAGGAIEVHHAGGRGLDAHLVLDRAATYRVGLAQRTVGVDQHLGHQKQRDTFGPGGRIGQPRQHQVDDVFGQVLLAASDEDLRAAEAVATFGDGLRAGADQPQVGASVRFGKAHGAGPAALVHRRQVQRLQRLAGMVEQCQAGPGGQHWVQAER